DRRLVELADLALVVDPPLFAVDERSLDVNSEDSRDSPLDCGFDRPHRPVDRFEIVADQGREEAGGSEGAVGAADRLDALDRRLVVEQHAAAAVDLQIDEAGDEIALKTLARCAGRAAFDGEQVD